MGQAEVLLCSCAPTETQHNVEGKALRSQRHLLNAEQEVELLPVSDTEVTQIHCQSLLHPSVLHLHFHLYLPHLDASLSRVFLFPLNSQEHQRQQESARNEAAKEAARAKPQQGRIGASIVTS